MQVKNVVSNILVDFVLELEKAISQGYKVVPESVDWQAGYWKAKTEKEGVVEAEVPTVFGAEVAVGLLDNPVEPNEELNEVLELDKSVERTVKPKRNRK